MSRIATFTIVVAVLFCVCGCAMDEQTARTELPATTPYDTNAVARAVYLRFYGDAYRIALAGRTNITYDYRGEYVHPAVYGQWYGLIAGIEAGRERELQALPRDPQLPRITPFDGEPEPRSAYLRSFRENYRAALSGSYRITCFPQTRTAEAACRGERDGQAKAMEDISAVEKRWGARHLAISQCLEKQQPQGRAGPSPREVWCLRLFQAFLKSFGL